MTKVLVLGGVSVNTMVYLEKFPKPTPQTLFSRGYHETIGSTGAGKALNFKKLGMEVKLHGMIGQDYYGDTAKAYLEQAEVPFIYDIDPQGTKRHVNLMDSQGNRISIFFSYGSFDPDFDIARLRPLIRESDYIVLNVINYCRRLIPIIQQHQKAIWCDIHDYDGTNDYHKDFLHAADYVFMSSDAMPDYKPFMQKLIDKGKKLVVCTHGKDGVTAFTMHRQWIDTPIIHAYTRQDTNGAGDSFFAGYLYGHSKGFSTNKCLRLGTIVAGLCVSSKELAYPQLSSVKVAEEYAKYYHKPLYAE